VQKAWIERLWEKAKGVLQLPDGTTEKSKDAKSRAYQSIRKSLKKIMYLDPLSTKEDTLEAAKQLLQALCDKCELRSRALHVQTARQTSFV
jgi:hypothetical protein